MSKAKNFSWLIVFGIALWHGFTQVSNPLPLRIAFARICDKVQWQIYLPVNQTASWYQQCLLESKKVTVQETTQQIVQRINSQLSQLRVSHLSVYSPSEVKKIWKGAFETTGILSHYLDGEVVVVKVIANSPAARAGILRGDLLQKINGELATVEESLNRAGEYEILRGLKHLKIRVTIAEVQTDNQFLITPLSNKQALLEVPSFHREFFADENWKKGIQELKKYSEVIIDLRNNPGGNFAAGLKFLSPFLCEPTAVGRLLKPKKTIRTPIDFPMEASDDEQIDILNKNSEIVLRTFSGFECLNSKLLVLVGPQTASTAEIVAQALHDYAQAPLWGASSSGQCLVGIWYALPGLGPGYEISIPEAIYQTLTPGAEATLEGVGVSIGKTLYERLNDYTQGKDSLVLQAQGFFSKRSVSQ